MGGFGLLTLGAIDSSILFLPFGNDLLVIAMSARKHTMVPYYGAMAAAGSVIGCLTVDLLTRRGSEKELERHWSKRRVEYVMRRMRKNALWTLATVSLMPPPFPFTPFVAAAAAAKYPRHKLLGVIGAARFVRFSLEGLLAIAIGRQLLAVAKSPQFEIAILALVGVCILASAYSIIHWTRQSKQTVKAEK